MGETGPVYIGSSDAAIAHRTARRLPIKETILLLGFLTIAAFMSMRNTGLKTSDELVQMAATAQAEQGNESDMQYVPESVQDAIVFLDMRTGIESTPQGGGVQSDFQGMGLIIEETDDTVLIVTDKHVAYPGALWEDFEIQSAGGKFSPIDFNPNMGLPGGPPIDNNQWYILPVGLQQLTPNITAIPIHKPPDVGRLTKQNITISRTPMYQGQDVVMIQGPTAVGRKIFAQCSTVLGTSISESGAPVVVINYATTNSASGGVAIDKKSGDVEALIEGFPTIPVRTITETTLNPFVPSPSP